MKVNVFKVISEYREYTVSSQGLGDKVWSWVVGSFFQYPWGSYCSSDTMRTETLLMSRRTSHVGGNEQKNLRECLWNHIK